MCGCPGSATGSAAAAAVGGGDEEEAGDVEKAEGSRMRRRP